MICIIDTTNDVDNVSWVFENWSGKRVLLIAPFECTEDYGEQRCFTAALNLYMSDIFEEKRGYREVRVNRSTIVS